MNYRGVHDQDVDTACTRCLIGALLEGVLVDDVVYPQNREEMLLALGQAWLTTYDEVPAFCPVRDLVISIAANAYTGSDDGYYANFLQVSRESCPGAKPPGFQQKFHLAG